MIPLVIKGYSGLIDHSSKVFPLNSTKGLSTYLPYLVKEYSLIRRPNPAAVIIEIAFKTLSLFLEP